MSQLLNQYQKIKVKYPDAVLLFRVGDLYGTFNKDAKTVGQVIGVSLSIKGNKMAISFPLYSLDNALRKLVKAGYKAAVCERLEKPKKKVANTKRDAMDFLNS